MDVTCGETAGYDCVDPSSSCEEVELVEAGTKTSISTTANAFDERAGAASGMSGCQLNGCEPGLTRDGVTAADAESRWSCAAKLVPGELPCAIDFVFEDPQDIVDVEIAFYKGDDRTRTVEVGWRNDSCLLFVIRFQTGLGGYIFVFFSRRRMG